MSLLDQFREISDTKIETNLSKNNENESKKSISINNGDSHFVVPPDSKRYKRKKAIVSMSILIIVTVLLFLSFLF